MEKKFRPFKRICAEIQQAPSGPATVHQCRRRLCPYASKKKAAAANEDTQLKTAERTLMQQRQRSTPRWLNGTRRGGKIEKRKPSAREARAYTAACAKASAAGEAAEESDYSRVSMHGSRLVLSPSTHVALQAMLDQEFVECFSIVQAY